MVVVLPRGKKEGSIPFVLFVLMFSFSVFRLWFGLADKETSQREGREEGRRRRRKKGLIRRTYGR